MEVFPKDEVIVMPQDSYYRDNSHISMEERQNINFDHPDSVEFGLLIDHLKKLKKGTPIEMPIYSYLTCLRSNETITIKPSHLQFIEPSKRYADIIIPGGGENQVGIEMLISIIEKHLLREKNINHAQ